MALTVNHLRGTETPDAPSITLYAHLSDPRGTRSLLSYWWSIPTGGEGHSYEAPWPRANCMKCFLRSSLYIIPQLSTSLYPSGGHGQPSLALTGRKLILLLLLTWLSPSGPYHRAGHFPPLPHLPPKTRDFSTLNNASSN